MNTTIGNQNKRDPNQRRENFRADYRAKIAKWYSGPIHVLVIYAIGLTAISFYLRHVQNVGILDLLVIPPTFLLCNIMEWVMHVYVMHRPVKGLMIIYKRHTLSHHEFFTHDAMTFDTTRDYRIVFFPPFALMTVIALSIPLAFIVGAVWSANAGWFFITTTTSMYLVYEAFHFSSHLPDNWLLRHLPFINTIRRHHEAHHNTGIMRERNMNLTFPIADWIFGTSDLNRGLLGTLFNGYNKAHVKPDAHKPRKPVTSTGDEVSKDVALSS